MKREKLIDIIKDLPQEFELEELLEKLILVEKVEAALKQVDASQVVPYEDVKELVKTWNLQ